MANTLKRPNGDPVLGIADNKLKCFFTNFKSSPRRLLITERRDSEPFHGLLSISGLEFVDEAALGLVNQLVDFLVGIELDKKRKNINQRNFFANIFKGLPSYTYVGSLLRVQGESLGGPQRSQKSFVILSSQALHFMGKWRSFHKFTGPKKKIDTILRAKIICKIVFSRVATSHLRMRFSRYVALS